MKVKSYVPRQKRGFNYLRKAGCRVNARQMKPEAELVVILLDQAITQVCDHVVECQLQRLF